MKADFETRLQNALDGLLQHIPETKQEAARMSAAQWAAFQDAANECAAIQGELSGSIRHNGTWIQIGRSAAEQVNNAAERLAQQN